jgi:uncharacterized protein (DUF1778 family)
MKKRAGRPKVAKNKAKSPGISIRLVQDDQKAIDKAIAASGLTQSDWARKALLSAAASDKPES